MLAMGFRSAARGRVSGAWPALKWQLAQPLGLATQPFAQPGITAPGALEFGGGQRGLGSSSGACPRTARGAPGSARTLCQSLNHTPQPANAPRRTRPGGAALPAARAALVRPNAAAQSTDPLASPTPATVDDEIGRALAAAAEQRARLAAALADESRWRLVIDCGFCHTLTAHKEVGDRRMLL